MKPPNLLKAAAWLVSKDLGDIPFSLGYAYGEFVDLRIDKKELDQFQLDLLDLVFGPFKHRPGESEATGKANLDENVSITLSIAYAYTCKQVDQEELDNQSRVDELIRKARAGHVKIMDCMPTEVKEEATTV